MVSNNLHMVVLVLYISVGWFICIFFTLFNLLVIITIGVTTVHRVTGRINHNSKQGQKTKHARHPTYQFIPVQRPVHTQSPALSYPPQWPRKCLAEILESYTRSRYALIFYIYVQYSTVQYTPERLLGRNLALRIGGLFSFLFMFPP